MCLQVRAQGSERVCTCRLAFPNDHRLSRQPKTVPLPSFALLLADLSSKVSPGGKESQLFLFFFFKGLETLPFENLICRGYGFN